MGHCDHWWLPPPGTQLAKPQACVLLLTLLHPLLRWGLSGLLLEERGQKHEAQGREREGRAKRGWRMTTEASRHLRHEAVVVGMGVEGGKAGFD